MYIFTVVLYICVILSSVCVFHINKHAVIFPLRPWGNVFVLCISPVFFKSVFITICICSCFIRIAFDMMIFRSEAFPWTCLSLTHLITHTLCALGKPQRVLNLNGGGGGPVHWKELFVAASLISINITLIKLSFKMFLC